MMSILFYDCVEIWYTQKYANLFGERIGRLIILNVNWVKQVVGNIL